MPAAKLGLGYSYVGLKRLVDIVGPSFAMEIFYTARQFTAEEARVMGLVNRIVPDTPGELEKYVKDYADMIADNAPLIDQGGEGHGRRDHEGGEQARPVKRSQKLVEACFNSNDYHEGRKAFMEKRKPVFTGT